ncbi:acyl-CoA N-acyltransferase [Aspergillus coremiiformis]|uniref:Acyl-CoA N-acyltransferase n=1 Tax=Aspergillus coremiiformis TaxID=138285 RepID=A0A5N6YYX4_9EURO|nr:acyl-CoA N-acyltransferase [Aspergillus coremiiformis]
MANAASTPSTLRLEEITLDDIPQMTEVWFRAFGTPHNLILFPDTPGVRAWWDETNRHDLLNRPYQKFIKVVDSAKPSCIVAYGKWDLEPDQCGERYPPWHEESNSEICSEFFGGIENQRRNVMQGRRHYYFDMLATNPDHQRRGAASLLVQWGCDLADRNGAAIYIASSQEGLGLYRKFGFVLLDGRDDTPEGVNPMVREPQLINISLA